LDWTSCPAETDGQAEAEVAAGIQAFGAGDYASAEQAFKESYAMDPSPCTLYAAAQSVRLEGDCCNAENLFKSLLRSNPPAPLAHAATEDLHDCNPGP
jgi:hypothetical protein